MNDITLRPAYYACVSGGKDSLYMLKLILNNLDKYPLDGVVHYELEIDYPFIKDVINFMRKECLSRGIRFFTIKPKYSFYELYDKYGFPEVRRRWCNTPYKMSAEDELKSFLHSRGEYLVKYIGFCADEEKRFKFELNERGRTTTSIYPLAEFGINESKILEWAKTVPIFKDYYLYNKRCGCMFCPMQTMMESAYLLKYYPEKFKEFINLVRKTEEKVSRKIGRKYSVLSINPKYDSYYREKVVREKWLPKLEEIELKCRLEVGEL